VFTSRCLPLIYIWYGLLWGQKWFGWCFTNCCSQGIYYKNHCIVIFLTYTWQNWMSSFTLHCRSNLFQELPAWSLPFFPDHAVFTGNFCRRFGGRPNSLRLLPLNEASYLRWLQFVNNSDVHLTSRTQNVQQKKQHKIVSYQAYWNRICHSKGVQS
jgi:hypothetical protein